MYPRRTRERARAIATTVYFVGAFTCAQQLGGWWAAGLAFCTLSLILLSLRPEAHV